MKKAVLLLFTLFLSLFSLVYAQTDEAQQRNRDIRIAEGILSEMFGEQYSEDFVLAGIHEKNVRGEYIPGYGVHFTVNPGFPGLVHLRTSGTRDEDVVVDLKQDENTSQSSNSEEEIRNKIYEYMTKYASLISGVPNDETIRVTYAQNRNSLANWIVLGIDSERQRESESGISVWARISDLKQFRNGNISEQQMMDRIHTYVLDNEVIYTDFNVFASVLETALNSTDAKYLRVSRKPQMEYLPGLGVRYRVQVSTKPSVILEDLKFLDGNLEFKMDTLRFNLDKSIQLMDETLNPLIIKLDSVLEDDDLTEEEREEVRKEMQEKREEIQAQRESIRKAMRGSSYTFNVTSNDSLDLGSEADAIMDQLLDVINNYGTTLTSLKNDEMLMISLDWTGRSDDLPERTEVRIKKSGLLRGDEPDIEEIERR